MKIAKVVANPFCAVDANGVPQGVAQVPGAPGVYIGARLDQVACERMGKKRFYFPRAKDGGPRVVEIEVSNAMVRADVARLVNDGALVAVDEETARCFGITSDFLPLEAVLKAEEAKALALYQGLKGKDAKLAPVPVEPESAPESDDVKPPAQKGIQLGGGVSLHPYEGQ